MKLIVTLIFTSFFLFSLPKDNDLSEEMLKGKVKSCTVTLYLVYARANTKTFVRKIRTDYNLKGYKTKVTATDETGEKKVYDYTYDAKGELINQDKEETKTVKVGKDGIKIETIVSTSGLTSIKKYSADQGLYERVTLDRNGKILSKALLTYDNDGKVVMEKVFDGDGNLSKTITYSYDGFQNRKEIVSLNRINEPTAKISYTYLPGGGPLVQETTYLRLIGQLQIFKTIKYSNFDAQNNWLQSITTTEGTDTTMNVREIEYY